MALIEWDERMAIGFYLVDQQHRELVVLINAMAEALEREASRSEVSRFIRRFYDYTTTHFQAEESLMDHETYPEYFNQVKEHLDCSLRALEYHRKFLEEDAFDLREFFDFIVHWFREHTMGIDQTLSRHLLERGGRGTVQAG